jgi:hypothetical protein
LHNIRFILNRKEPFKAAKIVIKGNIEFIIVAGTNWGRTREMGDSGFFQAGMHYTELEAALFWRARR